MAAPKKPREGTRATAGEAELEITARPKTLLEESQATALPEPGLSMTPEELGSAFLRDATEQGNLESFRGDGVASLDVTESAPTDEPLTGPNFEPDHDVWEATVDLTLQCGPLGADVHDLDEPVSESAEPETSVKVTERAIREGTLLDHEAAALGEVEPPASLTDETGKGRPRRRKPDRPRS